MKELWARLEALAVKEDKTLGLRSGASEKAVAAAEDAMHLRFPADFRASLLLHDGQEGDEDDLFEWMPGCSPLASLESIVEQWKDEQSNADDDDEEPSVIEDGYLHNVLFHPKRIPIAGTPDWDGDTSHLDLFPGPDGTKGQLITRVTESDMVVLGSSFSKAIEQYVVGLESGSWTGESGNKNRAYAYSEYLQTLDAPVKKKR
jgi:cell wall assembly regulator SMI1